MYGLGARNFLFMNVRRLRLHLSSFILLKPKPLTDDPAAPSPDVLAHRLSNEVLPRPARPGWLGPLHGRSHQLG